MNAQLTACAAVLDELYDGLIELIGPLDEDCLTWTPPIPETNSISALVRHIVGSMDSWLSRAVGETVQRDRDAEFRARHTAEELVALVQRSRTEARRRLALADQRDLGRTQRVHRLAANEDVDVSAAWCIEHALIHAGEHWGQIQLNRQLYAASH